MTNLSTRPGEATDTRSSSTSAMGFGRRLLWLGPTGLVAAVVFSAVEWWVVSSQQPAAGIGAVLAALTMTAPVVLARRWPVPAAAVLAAAAIMNGLLFPDIVRCAAAFPAAAYVAFAVGARAREGGRGWAGTVAGLAITYAGLLGQWIWDPALNVDTSFLPFGLGIATLAWAAGIGWTAAVHQLRTRRARQVG